MTIQKTINASKSTYDKLSKLSKTISLSETVALLISCNFKKDLNNFLKTSKPNRNFKELKGEGTKTFKVTKPVWQKLNKIRQGRSVSIVLNCLLNTYDKYKFKQHKKIKAIGR